LREAQLTDKARRKAEHMSAKKQEEDDMRRDLAVEHRRKMAEEAGAYTRPLCGST
jgi:hypothetical protein